MSQLYVPQHTYDVVLAFLHWREWRISRASQPAAVALQPEEEGRVPWPLLQEYSCGESHGSQEGIIKIGSGTWNWKLCTLCQTVTGIYKFLIVVSGTVLPSCQDVLQNPLREGVGGLPAERGRDWACLRNWDLPARADIHSSKTKQNKTTSFCCMQMMSADAFKQHMQKLCCRGLDPPRNIT